MTVVVVISFVSLIVALGLFIWFWATDKNREMKSLREDRDYFSRNNYNLLENIQRTQQAHQDQLHELSDTVVSVSTKLNDLQLNLLDVIDSKLKTQSEEFKKELNKVNSKVDTLLGLVMECDNENCPTKRKVSNYLKNQKLEN